MKGTSDFMRRLGLAALAAFAALAACNMNGHDNDEVVHDEDALSYTVTFSPGEGSGPAPESLTVAPGTVITLPGQGGMIAPDETIFGGWKLGVRIYPGGTELEINRGCEFTAQWIEEPIAEGKAAVRFKNREQFPARIYKDSSRITEIALVPASGTKRVEVDPAPMGTTFYPRFQIMVDGIPVFTQDETAITARVDVGRVTEVPVPRITAISGGMACVKIENQSEYSLTFTREGYEQRPLSADSTQEMSTIVMPQETALYAVWMGDTSRCAVMKNTSVPVAFPAVIQEFQGGGVYTFTFDGSALILTGMADVFGDPLSLRVSVSTAAEMEGVLASSKELPEINIGVTGDFSLGAVSLSGSERTVRISGGQAGEKTITLSGKGSLFTVTDGVTLILEDTLTLRGQAGNTASLVMVESGGTLTMHTGAKLTGNAAPNGGGAYVAEGGTFTLSGGEIGGNTAASNGGGAYVAEGGTFTLNGGEIGENSAASNGGGAYVAEGGTFTLNSGEIRGNSAASRGGGVYAAGGSTVTKQSEGVIYGSNAGDSLKNTAGGGVGHGVYVAIPPTRVRDTTAGSGVTLDSSKDGAAGGWEPITVPSTLSLGESLTWIRGNAEEGDEYTITVKGDETIPPNTLSYGGKTIGITLKGEASEKTLELSGSGSLFTVERGVTLTLEGGITLRGTAGNTASLVKVNSGGSLVMASGSKITGNAASTYGGGVYVSGGGAFTMSGGEISGNTATSRGGGVYAAGGSTVTKQSGGVIYGSNAGDSLKNTAGGGFGHGVYVAISPTRVRDTTAGSGVTLDSSKDGAAGGWEPITVPSTLSLGNSLTWISTNAEEGGAYSITVKGNEAISPKTLSCGGKTVGITLKGDGSERIISLSGSGSLFTIESGVTLTLNSGVTLRGVSGNTASLVRINSGGSLVMNTGAKITGNTYSYGSGVYVDNSAAFTLNGGEISGNTATASSYGGGGVYVAGGATFTLNSGKISGNTASSYGGGGVYVNGTFTLNGGEISGNTASVYGGGVYVAGTFTMNGGEISGNTASSYYSSYGGGVYVTGSGTFTKQSGVIYGSTSGTLRNSAGSDGHGVYVNISPVKKRNTTAGSGVILDSKVSGTAGGWE